MFFHVLARAEDPAGLEDDIDLGFFPGKPGRVTFTSESDFSPIDYQVALFDRDIAGKWPVGAVVLKQGRQHIWFSQIVYQGDLEFLRSRNQVTKGQTPDASKSVNATRIAMVITPAVETLISSATAMQRSYQLFALAQAKTAYRSLVLALKPAKRTLPSEKVAKCLTSA